LRSYINIDSIDPKIAADIISQEMKKQDTVLDNIENKIKVQNLKPNCSRKIFAVDSGLNIAYESPFTVIKSAVVDDEINVEIFKNLYLFHENNYNSERLKRLLMQINLYQAINKKIENIRESSLFLVDGTITLPVFTPTHKDSKEYQNLFSSFIEEIYKPLISDCIDKDILLLGFLKRTGSTLLSLSFNVKEIYDIYILNHFLKKNGDYISPILIPNTSSYQWIDQVYVTFFLNLNDWNYRFELIEQQKNKYLECIENLLFWSTRTHFGMNPIFSKADEYSRVTKREAELLFNQIFSHLSDDKKAKFRIRAQKKTHFGFEFSDSYKKIMK